MVRPRSCRVIYYFDTPALGRRHQSFGRVKFLSTLCGMFVQQFYFVTYYFYRIEYDDYFFSFSRDL